MMELEQDTPASRGKPDGPSPDDDQGRICLSPEDPSDMTTDPAPPEEDDDDDDKEGNYLLEASLLKNLPVNIKPDRYICVSLALFFDYRVKVSGIKWRDLANIKSGSDVSYEDERHGHNQDTEEIARDGENDEDAESTQDAASDNDADSDQDTESTQDTEESDADHTDERRLDEELPAHYADLRGLPIPGIISVNEEATGHMRVLGPIEITGLLRRALCMLPSEKFVCLDEIQTLISKLEGEELLDAVSDSLVPLFDNCLDGQNPHLDTLMWKINQALGLQVVNHRTRTEILGWRFEVYEVLEDGYLGLRSFLSDALITWDTEIGMDILGKHIAKLPVDAQRSIENYARIELDKQRESGGLSREFLA